jgi:tetratricopeptide (TPR) repeat protein
MEGARRGDEQVGDRFWVCVLGPLRAWRGQVELDLGPPRLRAALVTVLLAGGTPVSLDELVCAAWDDAPPVSAAEQLETYFVRLSGFFAISTPGDGYSLRLPADQFDLTAFQIALERAETARAAGDLVAEAAHLGEGLALWRGTALAGVPGLAAETRRAALGELRLAAVEAQHVNDVALSKTDQSPVPADPGDSAVSDVPARLPADLPTFVGRGGELARAAEFLPPGAEGPETVLIATIAGMAGIGKTTLAVHWAHRVAGRFPGGQVYVDLRGFDRAGSAMEPAEAIRTVLAALDVPSSAIPPGLDASAAYYRSLLAHRRVLILLDNVRDADQVRPLLPGTPGCLVIITSRNRLPSLVAREGARPLSLDLLSTDEAHDFLGRRLGAGRLAAEPRVAREIVGHCAGLPLALAIVSARAAGRPEVPLAAFATELNDSRGSLDAFAGDDTAIDTRTVFSWSYRALGEDAARLFRLLSLHPGPDLVTAAAASLAAMPLRQVQRALAELARAHLVTERSPGRFSCHELLRFYATELARESDPPVVQNEALHRLVDHYLHTAYTATALLYPREDRIELEPVVAGVLPGRFLDGEAALAWLGRECPVLNTLITQAFTAGFPVHTWKLAWAVCDFLQRQGQWNEQVTTQLTALAAARELDDPNGQAHSHRGLGNAYGRLGQFALAVSHLEQSRELFAGLGDAAAEARSCRGIAFVDGQQSDFEHALELCELALDLYGQAGHRVGEAIAFNDAGWCHAMLGHYREALRYCEQAGALFEDLGHHDGRANNWDSLGYIHHHLGDHDRAVRCYRQAIDTFRELGDRYNEADTLTHLGDTFEATGDFDQARAAWGAALTIYDEFGQPAAEKLRAKLETLGVV